MSDDLLKRLLANALDECDEAAAVIEALQAENARLRDERDDAISTLDAWFDRRELAHSLVDEGIISAARGYLRTSRYGGMPKEESDLVEGVIVDMARLSVFADIFARAALSAPDPAPEAPDMTRPGNVTHET